MNFQLLFAAVHSDQDSDVAQMIDRVWPPLLPLSCPCLNLRKFDLTITASAARALHNTQEAFSCPPIELFLPADGARTTHTQRTHNAHTTYTQRTHKITEHSALTTQHSTRQEVCAEHKRAEKTRQVLDKRAHSVHTVLTEEEKLCSLAGAMTVET